MSSDNPHNLEGLTIEEDMTTRISVTAQGVRMYYVESDTYQEVKPNGVFVLQEPRGELTLRFFFERLEPPDQEVYAVKNNKLVRPPLEQHGLYLHREEERVITREILVDVIIPPHRQKELLEFIIQQLSQSKNRK